MDEKKIVENSWKKFVRKRSMERSRGICEVGKFRDAKFSTRSDP